MLTDIEIKNMRLGETTNSIIDIFKRGLFDHERIVHNLLLARNVQICYVKFSV